MILTGDNFVAMDGPEGGTSEVDGMRYVERDGVRGVWVSESDRFGGVSETGDQFAFFAIDFGALNVSRRGIVEPPGTTTAGDFHLDEDPALDDNAGEVAWFDVDTAGGLLLNESGFAEATEQQFVTRLVEDYNGGDIDPETGPVVVVGAATGDTGDLDFSATPPEPSDAPPVDDRFGVLAQSQGYAYVFDVDSGNPADVYVVDVDPLRPTFGDVVYAEIDAVNHFYTDANRVRSFMLPAASTPQVQQVYVSGSAWSDSFLERLEASGLGDADYGYAVDAGQAGTIPWVNVNQIVLRYDRALAAGGGLPVADSIELDGQLSDYEVTDVAQLDPRTVLLTLDRPLGVQPAPAADPTQGDRVRLSVAGAGASGGAYGLTLNVLQGDADQRNGRVNATDISYVRSRQNRTAAEAPPAGLNPFDPFADLNADGRINATDVSTVRARANDVLPAAPTPAGLFSAVRIAEDVLA